jgi:nucleotide-binding universal stress UspA family protein
MTGTVATEDADADEATGPSAPPCIVVGYDGSPAAQVAVRLAADRVGDGTLYVVYAFDGPADFRGGQTYEGMLGRATHDGQELLDRLKTDCASLATVRWESELLAGPAAAALATVAATRHADEIIVGSRGFGRVRALLGSVAHEVIHLADCPVTVIPEKVAARHSDLPAPFMATAG